MKVAPIAPEQNQLCIYNMILKGNENYILNPLTYYDDITNDFTIIKGM